MPGLLGGGGANGGRPASRGGLLSYADHAGSAYFYAVAEGAETATKHSGARALGSSTGMPDLRDQWQLRVANGSGESWGAADSLRGGQESSESQEGPIASLHDVRPGEVHSLLTLS